jgi:hypothetical protein
MRSTRALIALAATLAVAALAAPAAEASPTPAWSLSAAPVPANVAPGGQGGFILDAANVGGADTSGNTVVEAVLPAGFTPVSAFPLLVGGDGESVACSTAGQTARCETSQPILAGAILQITVGFEAEPGLTSAGPVQATVSGGGAIEDSASASVAVQAAPVPFTILPGFQAPFGEENGAASLPAASHPYQQEVNFQFPTRFSGGQLFGSGRPRDIHLELPPGLVGDPAASPVLCTEAEFEGGGCPDGSAVGVIGIVTFAASTTKIGLAYTPVYNMVPPPGYPAELATDVGGLGIYLHLFASVRSEGDYGIEVSVPDILSLTSQPIYGSISQIWGDPSSPLHDAARGVCENRGEKTCPVQPQSTAFWTLASRCDGVPTTTELSANSWEEPGLFAESSYQSADASGSPVSLTDCGSLEFEPTISARPTTDLADSPSGLDFSLHQPQNSDKEQRSNPPMRKATVTLPEGMTVNPSQADGLAACDPSQIGLLTEVGATPIHFSKQPNTCPDASKLGTVEVSTPLIVKRDAEHRLETDPETHLPIQRPLQGSVYLAKPFDNPFHSLLALYLAVEDPETGTVAKLAGKVEPDPATGQLTTVFDESPQLPLEDIHLHLYPGARGSLITPPTCGTNTTTSDLVPWSAPDTPDATPQSSFQTTAAPAGGSCPGAPSQAVNDPAFTAGTLTRQAGAYSPFVLKVSREDGSQRLAGIDTTLPPGLTGKLAGIAECSDAQIAQAEARRDPDEGRQERESPSCPASTEVGTVNVASGAGPTPFYVQGHAYLAGPYKGAPLSLAIITPAVAGPFDLGTVVTRVALHVEPDTAQIHAVSDPLPTILDGIPLDVRSVALKMDRPEFTLNPTSCNPMAILGIATSALGQSAPLSQPFQVGGCTSLPFKPKLSLRLKGSVKRSSTPRLIANLKARPGEANVGAAQVKLPHAVFLDQAHIRTVCTRVQFAADACPAGSIYGKAEATTPLLGYPLSGSVYLRSNPAHLLPDLVAKLKGPASQPIEIDLAGKTDAVKAALRNTFEAVPDAPVSSFRLELFGGKRGLVEMSGGFCAKRRANVKLTGQNGKAYDTQPMVAAKCPKGKHHRKRGR